MPEIEADTTETHEEQIKLAMRVMSLRSECCNTYVIYRYCSKCGQKCRETRSRWPQRGDDRG